MSHADDGVRTDLRDELGEDRVDGERGCVDQIHRSGRFVCVVVHVPRLGIRAFAAWVRDDQLRRAAEVALERGAVLERCRKGERLEGASGLPVSLRREVELQPLAARNPDRHRAHLAVEGVDGDERARRVVTPG